ncbi:hypothetical protein BDQ17DRAFT_143498 [Cyathus striatus]|nr:hypothetical protein BDQ17DRAFT_143498 [Cyathus striatus]
MPPVEVKLGYSLPPTVQSIVNGWQLSVQSGATVAALLAATAAQLMGAATGIEFANAHVQSFLNFTCYASLLFNIGATATSFLILDKLGNVQFNASKEIQDTEKDALGAPLPNGDSIYATKKGKVILKAFRIGRKWDLLIWHWIICIFLGIFSLIVMIVMMIWMSGEKHGVGVACSCIAAFILLPWIFLKCFKESYE